MNNAIFFVFLKKCQDEFREPVEIRKLSRFRKNMVELSVICTGSSFRFLNRLLKTCMTDVRSFPVCYKNIRIQEGQF